MSPFAQALLEAAVDVLGAVAIAAAASHLLQRELSRPALVACLAVAGFDLVFRTSIRRVLAGVGKSLAGLAQRRAAGRRAPAVAGEALPLREEAPLGEPLPVESPAESP